MHCSERFSACCIDDTGEDIDGPKDGDEQVALALIAGQQGFTGGRRILLPIEKEWVLEEIGEQHQSNQLPAELSAGAG